MSATTWIVAFVLSGSLLMFFNAFLIWKIMGGVGRYFDRLGRVPEAVRVNHGWQDGPVMTPLFDLAAQYRKRRLYLRLLIWGSPPVFDAPPAALTALGSARLWALLVTVFSSATLFALLAALRFPLTPIWIVFGVWIIGLGAYAPGRRDAGP